MKNKLGIFIIAILILFCFSSNIKAEEMLTSESIEKITESEQITEETVYYTVTFIDEVRNTKVIKSVKGGDVVECEKVSDERIYLDEVTFEFFDRWIIRNGKQKIAFDFDKPIEEDLILYANYLTTVDIPENNIADLRIYFDAQGGNNINHQMISYLALLEEPEQPYKEGYKFLGWYTEAKGGEKWSFKKDKVRGTMTLYAHWEYVGTGNSVSPKTSDNIWKMIGIWITGLGAVILSAQKLKKNRKII